MSIKKLLLKTFKKIKAKLMSEILDKNAQDESKNIFYRLLQKIIKRFKSSANQNLQIKKKKKATKRGKEKSSAWDSGIKQIEALIQSYEEFIKKDFFTIILEAKALLREWRASLAKALMAEKMLPKHHVDQVVLNLQEINELYLGTEVMLDRFIQHCAHYQEVVKNVKREISPTQALNQTQSRLDRMIKNLEKGKEMIDLHNNQDYKFLTKYVQERGGREL